MVYEVQGLLLFNFRMFLPTEVSYFEILIMFFYLSDLIVFAYLAPLLCLF